MSEVTKARAVALRLTAKTIRAAMNALERKPNDPERLSMVLGLMYELADDIDVLANAEEAHETQS